MKLGLHIHFHMLFLEGVYIEDEYGASRFRRVKAPTRDELSKLTHTIAHSADEADQTPAEKPASMTPDQVRGRLWAKRLKRVFNIDAEFQLNDFN